jgi:NADH-quinone oxidoreductase subunit L
MVAAVGMGAFAGGMFHLVTHAFFKALLFLSAGSIILGMERGHHLLAHHEAKDQHPARLVRGTRPLQPPPVQPVHTEKIFDPNDMRNMGGLRKTMPVTFWVYLMGTLALTGIPPFAGFWSKDEILADSFREGFTAVYWLLTIAAFFTAFYMGRQIWMVFFGEPRHEAAAHAQESPKVITIPLIILAVLSVLGGALNLPGVQTLSLWLKETVTAIEPGEFVVPVALISTTLALLAIFLSWLLYGRFPLKEGEADPLRKMLGPVFTGMQRKWYVDEGYKALILDPYVRVSRFLAITIDQNFWHDWFHEKVIVAGYNFLTHIALDRYADQRGIDAFFNGIADWTRRASASLRRIENGFVRTYALAVLIGVVAIVGYIVFR